MGAFTIYAIKSAICLALLYLPYTLLMRRDTFHAFNRVLLLSIVALSLVLPLFNIPVISNALPIEDVSITREQDEAFGLVEEGMLMTEDAYTITPTPDVEIIEKSSITWVISLILIYNRCGGMHCLEDFPTRSLVSLHSLQLSLERYD